MSTGEAGDGRLCPMSSYPPQRLHFYGLHCRAIPCRPLVTCPSVTGWNPFEVGRGLILDVRALELGFEGEKGERMRNGSAAEGSARASRHRWP